MLIQKMVMKKLQETSTEEETQEVVEEREEEVQEVDITIRKVESKSGSIDHILTEMRNKSPLKTTDGTLLRLKFTKSPIEEVENEEGSNSLTNQSLSNCINNL